MREHTTELHVRQTRIQDDQIQTGRVEAFMADRQRLFGHTRPS
jgi:hypothetical protein